MLYTILEISQKLGTSKATIYRKIESISNISNHISIKNKTKYIDDIGFNLIAEAIDNKNVTKENLDANIEIITDEKNSESDKKEETQKKVKKSEKVNDDLTIKHTKYIESLEQEIEYLREEMQMKNSLIEEQIKQIGNSQMLLLDNKRKMSFLESNIAVVKEEEDKEEYEEKRVSKPINFLKKMLNIKVYS